LFFRLSCFLSKAIITFLKSSLETICFFDRYFKKTVPFPSDITSITRKLSSLGSYSVNQMVTSRAQTSDPPKRNIINRSGFQKIRKGQRLPKQYQVKQWKRNSQHFFWKNTIYLQVP